MLLNVTLQLNMDIHWVRKNVRSNWMPVEDTSTLNGNLSKEMNITEVLSFTLKLNPTDLGHFYNN